MNATVHSVSVKAVLPLDKQHCVNESHRRSLTIDAMGNLTAAYTSHTTDTHATHTGSSIA